MFRYALSPRWLAWHLLCLVLVGGMIAMGVWQWLVATSPASPGGPSELNLRNLVYAFQWWVFAAFGVWFWYRFIRDQRDADAKAHEAAQAPADASAGEPEVAAGQGATNVDAAGPTAAAGLGQDAGDQQISLDAPASVRLQRANSATSQTPERTGGE